jgi:hypothetical protein
MKRFLVGAAWVGLAASIAVGVWIWIARFYDQADTAAAAARE